VPQLAAQVLPAIPGDDRDRDGRDVRGDVYMNTFELDHVRWSEQRLFMVLLMGSTMAIVMLGLMLGMYRNWKANIASSSVP
jgi:hypothetical protein